MASNDTFNFGGTDKFSIPGTENYDFTSGKYAVSKPKKKRKLATPAKKDSFSKPFSKFTGDLKTDEMVSLLGRFGAALNPGDNDYGRVGTVAADFGDQKRALREKKREEGSKHERAVNLLDIREGSAMDRTKEVQKGAKERSQATIDANISAADKKYGRSVKSAATKQGYEQDNIKLRNIGKKKTDKEKDVLEYVDTQMQDWYEGRGFEAPEPSPQEIAMKRAEFRARRTMANEGKIPAFYNGEMIYVDKDFNAFDKFGRPIPKAAVAQPKPTPTVGAPVTNPGIMGQNPTMSIMPFMP